MKVNIVNNLYIAVLYVYKYNIYYAYYSAYIRAREEVVYPAAL